MKIKSPLMVLHVFMMLPVAFSLIACSDSRVESIAELQAFISDPDNNLTQQATVGEYQVTVTYRPTDLLVHQDAGDEPADQATWTKLRGKYLPYHYFILSLSRNNKEALHQPEGGMPQYSELVQTLSFRMNEYVTLTTAASDTVPVGDFMLNRTYGMSASTDLLFVFSREKTKDQEWIQFNLNEFGLGIGNHRFRFRTSDIENIPELKIM